MEHSSGHATRLLRQAIGYQGSPVAFIQMLAAMDRDGEITREIKGKRTFRIVGTSAAAGADLPRPLGLEPTGQPALEIDYQRLASAIVDELTGRFAALVGAGRPTPPSEAPARGPRRSPVPASGPVGDQADYQAQLEEARARLDELLTAAEGAAGGPDRPQVRPVFQGPANSRT